ncbi:hypothetical protein Y032_0653g1169 [Ancylostoma ceylanicum]|uniref:Uncharacterized protein n=1 Tax=Ancylostoma ceylanicum TaxID=53326 RepID=A0A016WIP0_9BILA|nr:hypothetical protein Y032_0653g1169 [Ancylostoma ceylanicum]
MFQRGRLSSHEVCPTTRSSRGDWIALAKLCRGDQIASLEACSRHHDIRAIYTRCVRFTRMRLFDER